METLYSIYREYPSIQTDTRKLSKGDIFFALKGDNFNGNQFAAKAIEMGAAYAVIDEKEYEINGKTILTENVLSTLQQLAGYHRQQFSIPFLAITGSNGKTTTKELIHAVLSAAYKTYTTEGNLNNHIGIPLTILKIKNDAEIAVIEMGANHRREIEGYCRYTQPTHGLITNCGKAHLEGFGGIEGVRKGKGELYDFLRENNGTAFLMNDYDYLRDMAKGISSVFTYGTAEADVEGVAAGNDPFLDVSVTNKGADRTLIHTKLVGEYNLPNILAAVAVGRYFNVPEEKIKEAIEAYTPSNSRSQLLEMGSNKIILDAYNANPSSMRLAIENLGNKEAKEKVLLLGAMAELGSDSLEEHRQIAELIKKYRWKEVVLVGGDFLKIDHPFRSFADAAAAREWFSRQHFTDTVILIKGSRSMKMEKVLES